MWPVLDMADWDLDYYYIICSIPYRFITITQLEKLGVAPKRGTEPISYHCEDKVIQPSSFIKLMVMICFGLRPIGNWAALLVVETLLGTSASLLVQSRLSSSQKCKDIYDSWGMKFSFCRLSGCVVGSDLGCSGKFQRRLVFTQFL